MRDQAIMALCEGEEEFEMPKTLAYEDLGEEYLLHTSNEDVLKLLSHISFNYNLKTKTYTAKVVRLPKVSKEIDMYEHKVKKPTAKQLSNIQEKYTKYTKMQAVVDKMHAEMMKMQDSMTKDLLKVGLSLKAGSPLDRQLMMDKKSKTRIHHQESKCKSYDMDMIEHFAADYPELKKCIKVTKQKKIDRQKLEEVLENLPANVSRRIVELEINYSFCETPMKKPDCNYCGGKKEKLTKMCKRCGLK